MRSEKMRDKCLANNTTTNTRSKSSKSQTQTPAMSDMNSVQINALNLESRRSAFSPYRPSTVLTNLQRGNIQTQASNHLPERSIHQLAAIGELFINNLDDCVDVDELDSSGFSPLIWASSYGQLSCVKLLISRGANANIRAKHGETALLLSSANGHIHVLKELIGLNVDVNECDEDGNTALMFAANGNHALCANELIKAGADISLENSNLDTAYSIAVKNGSKQVEIILERHIIQLLS